jgi:uncharacterized protein
MVVGILRVTLSIPGADSLKGKRHVLRKVVDRVKARFNVSIAEVGENDIWQRAVVGVATVGNDRRFVNEVLDKVLRFVEEMYLAPVISHELEIQSLGEDLYAGGGVKEL